MNIKEIFSNKNKRLACLISAAALLLSIPFIAMQFSKEVNWGLFDFFVMGVLLFGTAFILEFIFRRGMNWRSKIILSVLVLIVFSFIWAELAVGIFGLPFSGS